LFAGGRTVVQASNENYGELDVHRRKKTLTLLSLSVTRNPTHYFPELSQVDFGTSTLS